MKTDDSGPDFIYINKFYVVLSNDFPLNARFR
jgi:hypothetical protein